MVEDVTDIVLNLKKVLVISHKADPVTLTIEVEKEGEVTAGDISPAEGIEIINPEQIILTTDRKLQITGEMVVTVGRGFCLGEDSKSDDQPIGMINVDALYSPVKLVKYEVQNTRVGQMTDYDKLLLKLLLMEELLQMTHSNNPQQYFVIIWMYLTKSVKNKLNSKVILRKLARNKTAYAIFSV